MSNNSYFFVLVLLTLGYTNSAYSSLSTDSSEGLKRQAILAPTDPNDGSYEDSSLYYPTQNDDGGLGGRGDHHPSSEPQEEEEDVVNSIGEDCYYEAGVCIPFPQLSGENSPGLPGDINGNFNDEFDLEKAKQEAAKQEAENKAREIARRIAETDRTNNINQAITDGQAACRNLLQEINSKCLPVVSLTSTNTDTSGGAASCQASKSRIENALPKSRQQANQCGALSSRISASCKSQTALYSGTGTATVRTPVTASATVSVESDRETIPGNANNAVRGADIISSTLSKISPFNQNAPEVIRELEQCIASLKSTTQPVASTNPPPTTPPPGNNPPDPIAPGSQGSDNPPGGGELGGLGQIASGVGSLFNSGDDSGSSESASTSSEATKLRVNDTRANNSQFTAPSLSRNSLSLDGGSGGLGGADGIGDPDLSRDTTPNNSQFTQNGGNSNNNNNAQRSPTGGGFAGTRGGGNFGAANRAGGSGPTNRGTRRSASSTKTRNIISGYKKVKPSDGGGSLAIKPSAFKRYGKAGLKTKLKTARKKFGKDVPLIFKNGQFVLDFLALKEKKGFKSRQAAMETYWRGQGKAGAGSREGTSFEACNPNECHQNPNLNMFKIMNFRFQKQFNNVKTQDI